MQSVEIETYSEYEDYLEVHPDEFIQLFNTILINVTSFFRDYSIWNYLGNYSPAHGRQVQASIRFGVPDVLLDRSLHLGNSPSGSFGGRTVRCAGQNIPRIGTKKRSIRLATLHNAKEVEAFRRTAGALL